jgi:hypothetical protein
MYTICSRCQFKVPASRSICHICGNAKAREQYTAEKEARNQAAHGFDSFIASLNQPIFARIFTRRRREQTTTSQQEQLDYLAAYKASFERPNRSRKERDSAPLPDFMNGQLIVKELRTKVDLLDESSVTRMHLDDLMHWFEDFGRDGIIVRNPKDDVNSSVSDAA